MNITGRLTRDAEVKTLDDNRQVVNFSVAVNDSYKNKQGERIEHTAYFDCSYWISPNVAKLLTKGSLVELTGRVSVRAWADTDGQAHAGLNFHTSQIKLHSLSPTDRSSDKKAETAQAATGTKKGKRTVEETMDDLPF
ncbi:single-stranded DNA-binding protein [Parapedobacter sp. 10938]|uniref:single-stranded DNA-binding protein n=1 Tax=Parapedobacter flavus TaxID=3110225 RepID=UPI002DBE331F|nr:single-stranded DNA-binding protein [Parapedobacter sp. 10938]MEC3880308.1 single-stranded DNA-binding protein [Parapedobacter sp. 10938]